MAATQKGKQQAPPPEDNQSEGNGKTPAHVVSYYVAKDCYIQASVWERTIENNGNPFSVYDVSLRKRQKEGNDWKSYYSFRASEIPYVLRAVARAEEWILDQKKQDVPF